MNDQHPVTQQTLPQQTASNTIRWLMLAILAWGLILALGTFLFGGNHAFLRALIVAGCTLAFLALWLAALALQRRNS
jgi:high-affinity Fe2+/Pb2+ permease